MSPEALDHYAWYAERMAQILGRNTFPVAVGFFREGERMEGFVEPEALNHA